MSGTGTVVRVDIVTIFPEYLAPLGLSLLGRAQAIGALEINVYDLRRWTHDVHRSVDDTPYGGGPGMVMRAQPWGEALDDLLGPAGDPRPDPAVVVIPSPAGTPFTQRVAGELAGAARLVFVCGRYEGIDARVAQYAAGRAAVREISIGDYVLFGGEVAALVMLEALGRLLPGVLGNAESLLDESHTAGSGSAGLLEAPVYTKPATWRGLEVPPVLRSGDHARVARWRRDQSLLLTAVRRPDLLARATLDTDDKVTLAGGGFPVGATDMAQ